MRKEERQAKIEQLVLQNAISTQDELMQALRDEGISATQATISRDIRELHIVKKTDSTGRQRYTIFKTSEGGQQKARLFQNVYDNVERVDIAEFIIVLHTTPRSANGLAAIIDDYGIKHVIGTLAGYDTIVLICDSSEHAKQLAKQLSESSKNGKENH